MGQTHREKVIAHQLSPHAAMVAAGLAFRCRPNTIPGFTDFKEIAPLCRLSWHIVNSMRAIRRAVRRGGGRDVRRHAEPASLILVSRTHEMISAKWTEQPNCHAARDDCDSDLEGVLSGQLPAENRL
jgi:hypothetical protein